MKRRKLPNILALATVSALLLSAGWASAKQAGSRGISIEVKASAKADAPVQENVELYSDSYALIIGIDGYNNGWPKLSNAIKDAELIAATLKEKGFQVTYHKDLKADQLEDVFKEFFIIQGEKPTSRLFVWFAGHGHTLDGEGYLVPADSPVPAKEAEFKYSALNMRRFGTFMRQAKSKHVYAVFDACFAGTVFNSQRAMPSAAITRATTLPVRQFLTSGDANQTVSDDGAFRQLFLRAINGEEPADSNGDGYLTGTELGLYLGDRVTNLTQSLQTPRYGKLRDKDFDRGDFVFVLPGADIAEKEDESSGGGDESAAEIAFWESIKDSKNQAAFDAYLQQYPDGVFALLANLKKTELANATSRPTPQPVTTPANTQVAVVTPQPANTTRSTTTQGQPPAPAAVQPQPQATVPQSAPPAPRKNLPPVNTASLIANADVAPAIRQRMTRYLTLAQEGNSAASFSLGYMFDGGGIVAENKRAAEKWYLTAAEKGNTRAQVNLAKIYEKGAEDVPQDWNKAIRWYRSAAEDGDADAQERLGFIYEQGVGLSRDLFAAAEYYLRAAEQGLPTAQNNLGAMFETGAGVKQDKDQAALWYAKAAAQGNEAAKANLERLRNP